MPTDLPITVGIAKTVLELLDKGRALVESKKDAPAPFPNLVEPTFEDLLLIHANYVDVFTAVVQWIGDASKDPEGRSTGQLADWLEQHGREFMPARQTLRALADVGTGIRAPVGEFFAALGVYMDASLDHAVTYRPRYTWVTCLLEDLRADSNAPGKVPWSRYWWIATHHRDRIRQRFALVCEAYADARIWHVTGEIPVRSAADLDADLVAFDAARDIQWLAGLEAEET